MTAILKQLSETWKVSEEQRQAWAEQMSDRFRAMCRHVQQARIRRLPPAWLESLELPKWESESRPLSAAAVVPEPRAATEEVKVAQWDHDLGKAYTVLPGASNCETNIFPFEFCMISSGSCHAGQVRLRLRQKCAERFMYVDQVTPA